jgi:hypothetical protein
MRRSLSRVSVTVYPMKLSLQLLCLILLLCSLSRAGNTQSTSNSVPAILVFSEGARILFQGDSITDGNRGRSADPNHILGHGYVFIIAAKYGAYLAPLNLEFMNRGNSGNTASISRNAGPRIPWS